MKPIDCAEIAARAVRAGTPHNTLSNWRRSLPPKRRVFRDNWHCSVVIRIPLGGAVRAAEWSPAG